MDALSIIGQQHLPARYRYGLHSLRTASRWVKFAFSLDQFYHHHLQHARAWHEDVQATAICVSAAGDGVYAVDHHPGPGWRDHDDDLRPGLRNRIL
jgi:hypothetical protein